MSYDVTALRAQFPALASGTAFFDGPGGSQTPAPVADAVLQTMVGGLANRGRVTPAEAAAESVVSSARAAVGDLLGADPGGIVFGRSMTALTYEFSRTLARTWRPGDEVVVTGLDHDANVSPWVQAAASAGATVRWADFDPATGELRVEDIAEQLSDRTRLVAVTGASNLIGTRPPLPGIAAAVHGRDALFYVDAVHLTAHAPIDLDAIGADLLVYSPYKVFGPHCGVLAGRPGLLADLHPDKLAPSSEDVPERFELGTLPYELLAGTAAAIDFLAELAPADGSRRDRVTAAMIEIAAHEDRLRRRVESALADLPGTVVHSRAAHRTPTVLVTFADHDAADAYRFLADRGVNAPAGSFYAARAARRLGLGDAGGMRIGISPYTDDEDVDRLIVSLAEFLSGGPGR